MKQNRLLRSIVTFFLLLSFCTSAYAMPPTAPTAVRPESKDWARQMVGASYAAEHGITGKGVKVAIIDSGLCPEFSEYSKATLLPGKNLLASPNSTGRSDVRDANGHGTFIASIIAGSAYGFAPEVTLLPLKIFQDNLTASDDVADAIHQAIDAGCDVISMSFGFSQDDPTMRSAIAEARSRDIILVTSAGNQFGQTVSGPETILYPAAYPGVIAVGAVDAAKQVSTFSTQNEFVDIVAPGSAVYGLSAHSLCYVPEDGTSFSAPIVAAAAALARSVDPTITADRFLALMQETAEDLGEPGRDDVYGGGLLNLGLLLAELRGDEDSLIVSKCRGASYLSAYWDISAQEDGILCIAAYDEDGRFLSLRQQALHTGKNYFNNVPLTAAHVSLAVLDRRSGAVLRGVLTD